MSKKRRAKQKKRRRKQQGSRGPSAPKDKSTTLVVDSPKKRLKRSFLLLEQITSEVQESLSPDCVQVPNDRVYLAIFERSYNCLKAIQVLLENGHWEIAEPVVRQLYELLINTEHLLSLEDRDQAIERYVKYGLLQHLLRDKALGLYGEARGSEVPEERQEFVESLLNGGSFDEFRSDRSPTGWVGSWTGESAWKLAQMSPAQPIRTNQYRLMFTSYSEQSHGTPSSMLPSVYRMAPMDVAAEIARDDLRIVETMATAVGFFVELWSTLPRISSYLDQSLALKWHAELLRQLADAWEAAPSKNFEMPLTINRK